MADVFISYKSDRRAAAGHLARVIELHGYSVWFDYSLMSGRDFSSQIEKELRAANAVVVLWCKMSRESTWVKEEARLANRLQTLIPAWLEKVDQPLGFQLLETIDLSKWDGSPAGGAGIDKLLMEIARLVGSVRVVEQELLWRYQEDWRRFGALSLRNFPLIEPLEEKEKSQLEAFLPPGTRPAPRPERETIAPEHGSPSRRTGRGTISNSIEEFVLKYQELEILIFSGVSGFAVDFLSFVAGVYYVALDSGKLVGFLCAPNWTVMYVILFPMYNFFFSGVVNRVNEILPKFVESGVITGGKRGGISTEALMEDWRRYIGSASRTLWMLLILVALISIYQWYTDCFQKLFYREVGSAAHDWSTISIVAKNSNVTVAADVWFSALAYIYMAIALWIYTVVPIYSATFANYLSKLSVTNSGRFVLVLQPEIFSKEIADLTWRVFACAFLGILATYLMSLQAAYLQSPESNIVSFMFSGERHLIRLLIGHGDVISRSADDNLAGINVTSAFTCWPVGIYALITLFFYLALMQKAYANAKQNYLKHISAFDPLGSIPQASRVRSETFVDSVMPTYRHLIVLIVSAVACSIVPSYGSLMVATLCYAGLRFFIVSKVSESSEAEHPQVT